MGRLKIKKDDDRIFTIRMPRSTWLLLKKASLVKEKTMADICVELIENQRHKLNKKFEEIEELADIN